MFGGKKSGDDGIDADFVGGPFAGEIAGEIVHGGLGERVGEDAGEGIESGNRAEIDDGRGAGILDEVFAEDLAGAEDGAEIGVDDALYDYYHQ